MLNNENFQKTTMACHGNSHCVPLDELLLYSCDLALAVLSGLLFAVFNLFIGHYLTVSVAHHGHPDHFPLLQCIVHFLSAGTAIVLLAFLHHTSINTNSPATEHRLSTVYRRQLGLFVRDLTFLLASISIGFARSWPLSLPVLLFPILVTAWTTLLENQKPPIVRGLFLAGPLCLFFLNLSLGGLYGTYLVDLKLLRQPGIIFTIVAGIGSSAIQFAKARAQFKPLLAPHHAPQLYIHDENLDKLEYEKNPVEQYTSTEESTSSDRKDVERGGMWKDNGGKKDQEKDRRTTTELIRSWARIQLFLLKKWPCLCSGGLVVILAHAFGYPVFTRLTGLFFSVFESKLGKEDSLIAHVQWICLAYATMGLIVLVAVTLWNTIFGRMGIHMRDELDLQKNNEKWDKSVDWEKVAMVPLLSSEFFYGFSCILISVISSLQNNRPMGLLAVVVFSSQVLLQFLACKHLNKSKYGRAVAFASTNGLQQFSQALAYAGGFILVQLGLVTALNVFKIIQTMHLGSMGMTSVVLLSNDFAHGAEEMKLIIGRTKTEKKRGGKKVVPVHRPR